MFKYLTHMMLTVLLIAIMSAGHVQAAPNYTGTYMFTEEGNDNGIDTIEDLINQWFKAGDIDYDVELIYGGKLENEYNYKANDNFSFIFSDRNEKSGVWNAVEPVSFYSVKAGNQYAMYWVNPVLSTGLFSTEHLTVGNGKNNPDLSHITFWMVEDTYVPSSVPESSTMVLFSLGLIGLAGISRKKRKKQQAQ